MTPERGVFDHFTYGRSVSSRLRDSLNASRMDLVTSQNATLVLCRFTFAIILHCTAFLAHSALVLYSCVCTYLPIASGESLGVSASLYVLDFLL